MRVLFCFVHCALAPLFVWAIEYEVRFIGLKDMAAIQSLLDVSELVSLQKRPPASLSALKYRISNDIPSLIQTLHAYGFYDASITSDIVPLEEGVRVDILLHPGIQYKIGSYEIYTGDCTQLAQIPMCAPLTPDHLGLTLGTSAFSPAIINAELKLLTELARCGYPLAEIQKRRVIVDMEKKQLEAATCIQEGPLSLFGPISYFGVKETTPEFIESKVVWKEGSLYNADLIAETQERLLRTELFSSVYVSHGDTLDGQGELPIKVRVTEAKHRQITLGAYYATVDGPGAIATWTHRNVRRKGEILTAKGEISKRYWAGNILFKKPDFLRFDQTYRASALVARENIHAYLSFMYRFANYVDRPIGQKKMVSFGLKVDQIDVSKSANNGSYLLVGLPIFAKWDRSDDPLDPKQGYTIAYSVTPYQSMQEGGTRFVKQRFTTTAYLPLTPQKNLVFAWSVQFGSIAGTKQKNVPLPKLFLGGSEDNLRGYKYKTVSPVIGTKPLGGRSAIFTSAELRLRIKQIGIVPFADFGTVTFSEIPSFNAKWFKSVGLGLRYFAFFGPLRVDVGFPLDRRKQIDSRFQIYASVGQSF